MGTVKAGLAARIRTGAKADVVNAIRSTDQSWCELAVSEFIKATGIRVLQTRKPTGEAFAQIRAEAANPKTDLWWGGTGDPYYQAAEVGLLDPNWPGRPARLGALAERELTPTERPKAWRLGERLPMTPAGKLADWDLGDGSMLSRRLG